ncbi:putative GPI-anchored protein pfl2 [Pistacia vera]|uniref:putative GPI-anchored protein pfl2 n=1 Tax=Pistacia vera TaxID=55513 RepID=UPI001263E4C1|nr:putative GPI-anchored protein pfl2 [Pistacia vera]
MANPSKPTDGHNSSNELLNQSTNRIALALANSLQVISPQLTQSSYRFWSSQVLSTVGSHKLEAQFLLQKYEIRLEKFNTIDLYNCSVHIASTGTLNSSHGSISDINHVSKPELESSQSDKVSGSLYPTPPTLMSLAAVNGFGVLSQHVPFKPPRKRYDAIRVMKELNSSSTQPLLVPHLLFATALSSNVASANASALASQDLQYKSIRCRNPFVSVEFGTSFVSAKPDVQGHSDASFIILVTYIKFDATNQYVSSKNNDDVVHNPTTDQCSSSPNNKTYISDNCTAQTHNSGSHSVPANINACIYSAENCIAQTHNSGSHFIPANINACIYIAENCIAHTYTIAPHCLTSSVATDPFVVNITPDNHVSDDIVIGKNSSPLNSSSFNPNTYSPLLSASTNCNSPSSPNVTSLPTINTSLDHCSLPCNKPGSSENTTATNPIIEAIIPTRSTDCFLPPCPLVVDLTSSQFSIALVSPSLVFEALKSTKWKAAMQSEFYTLVHNNTWTLVPSSSNINIVGNKWVFRTKLNANGTLQKYKARLVNKGFQQTPSLDYFKTFSPVIKSATIRIVLTLAVTNGWDVQQIDVNNACLNGVLTETVYMK